MSPDGPHISGRGGIATEDLTLRYRLRDLIRACKTGIPGDQLAQLAEYTPVYAAVTISMVLLVSVLVLTQVSLPWIYAWSAAQGGLMLLVFLRWQQTYGDHAHASNSPTTLSRKGFYRAVAGAALSGGLWGSLSVFLPDLPQYLQIALILTMGGMAAGASAVLAAVPPVATVFILGCGLPVTVFCLQTGNQSDLLLALVFAIFTAAMIANSQVVYIALHRRRNTKEQARQLQEARLQQRVAAMVNESTSVDQALQSCLDEICRYMAWPAGHVYLLTDKGTNELVSSGIWYTDNEERFRDLRRLTDETRFAHGQGFPGRALEALEPIWDADGVEFADLPLTMEDGMSNPEFPRSEALHIAGVKGVLGIPVAIGSKSVAVLELFSDKPTTPSARLLRTLTAVATMLGRTLERQRAADELRRSRERLDNAQRIAQVGSFEWNTATDELHWSNEIYRVFGIDPAEFTMTDHHFMKMVHPDDREAVRAATEIAIGRAEQYAVDHRIVRPSGEIRYVRSLGEMEESVNGTPEWLRGTVQDVTDQRRAEETARREETRAKNYLNIAGSIIYAIDANERLTLINRAGCHLLECEDDAVLGSNWFDKFVPEDQRALRRTIFGKWMRGEADVVSEVEGRIISLKGKELFVRWKVVPLKDDDGNVTGVLSSGHDLTDQRHAEKQLHQAQKMEIVGQLTSGIAHDFNNVLAVVMGNLDLAIERAKSDKNVEDFLSAAMQGVQKGADLNRQLLTFSRQQVLEERVLNVNEIIHGMSGLLERALGESIAIETVLSKADCFATLDLAQFESAILNLAINARDAMVGGGELRIETAVIFAEDLSADEQSQDVIRISISDSGSGMTAEVRDHALEPFFTTKEVGAGSGLGLSMVYGFVTQTGGQLDLESAPGSGTTIHITLPSQEGFVDVSGVSDRSDLPTSVNSEVVLVVEDQKEVRDVIVSHLDDLGYVVLEAEDGNKAIRITETVASIDLILSDMVLPGGLGGEEVIAKARSIIPDVKSLHMSGNPLRSDDGAGNLRVPILRKPFRKADLAWAVRNCLGGSSSIP